MKAGWLRFQPARRAGPTKAVLMADDEQHPKLEAARAQMARDPSMTKARLAGFLDIGVAALRSWEKNGWIKFEAPSKPNNTLYWLKGSQKGKYRAYDPTMVKSRKK